jgi:hypothetical protein
MIVTFGGVTFRPGAQLERLRRADRPRPLKRRRPTRLWGSRAVAPGPMLVICTRQHLESCSCGDDASPARDRRHARGALREDLGARSCAGGRVRRRRIARCRPFRGAERRASLAARACDDLRQHRFEPEARAPARRRSRAQRERVHRRNPKRLEHELQPMADGGSSFRAVPRVGGNRPDRAHPGAAASSVRSEGGQGSNGAAGG